jgi:uncharacterized membrane protein YfcA
LSQIQKVEIVVPAIKLPKRERVATTFAKLLYLAARTLIVFWFVASWFPELGLTYWSLVLPVWIASTIFVPISIRGRFIPADRLQRTGFGTEFTELTTNQRKSSK